MKIILLQNINNLGKKGDIKNVSDGYAINFLIPKKLVETATIEKIEKLKKQSQPKAGQPLAENKGIEKIINKLKGTKIIIKRKVSDSGKLFAGISAKDVVQELKKQKKIEVKEKFVQLEKKIKNIGKYKIKICFNLGFESMIDINVLAL